ncbi:hypothetical protein [Fusobacterium ulcerans]|uniref:hypothetical protein n=1 Tax=Fusobacterium ulcerans TaxID=861 RepID=UPI001030B9FB|nr:hypothetical protein [Fusobacterium ulcerans]
MKKALSTEIVEIAKVRFEIKDDSILMPSRIIEEYWTLDGRMVGKIDPLDDYLAIKEAVKKEQV